MNIVNEKITKIDANGKVCPMPAALMKKTLKKASPGEFIEMIGDFEPALENVVTMAKKLKAEIIEKEKGENYFRILVRAVK